jgi:amino acid transporter
VAEAGGGLRRELGLRDVTLFATTCVMGTRWIPAAAHAGPGTVTLWLITAVFFMAPLAVAVGALAAKYPGAGGLYTWARRDFGPWHGFLCFWVYWMGIAFWFPTAALYYMSTGVSALGSTAGHLAADRFWMLAIAIAAIWIALGTNLVGLRIGKWTENLGGAATWLVTLMLVAIAVLICSRQGSATPIDVVPKWDWQTVNLWSNLAYAMSGLELAAMMGAEIHDPARTLPRAGWIASGVAVVFYVSTTVAMLVVLRPEKISEMNGLAELGTHAAGLLGAQWIAPALALLVLASGVGQIGGIGTGVSRLPFAAGADHMLPAAFGRAHPRWGTPHVAIFGLGAVATFLLAVYQLGDTMRAAYDELVSLMVITGFLPYLYIFASAWKAGKHLSALCGWAVTTLTILCAVVPTAEIRSVWLFEGKLAAGTLAVIGAGWLLYRRALNQGPSSP